VAFSSAACRNDQQSTEKWTQSRLFCSGSPRFRPAVARLCSEEHTSAPPRLQVIDLTPDGQRPALDRHLLPVFGRMVLAEIERADVASFIAAKHREGLAQGTINRIVAALSSIFSMAVREVDTTGINGNPAARHGGARRPEIKARAVRPVDIYDDEQVADLLDHVERDPRVAKHATLVWTLFYTGARMGEIFGLQPGNFDFPRGVVDIQRQVQWMRNRDAPEHPPASWGSPSCTSTSRSTALDWWGCPTTTSPASATSSGRPTPASPAPSRHRGSSPAPATHASRGGLTCSGPRSGSRCWRRRACPT